MNNTKQFKIILICFVLSGLTSLVYEVLWIRTLALSIGSTSASLGIVTSIFFAGLSLGSFISGQLAKKIHRPLKLYAYLELFIGLYSAGLIYILINLQSLVLPFTDSVALKYLFIGLLLLPPTSAMGATLPILVKALPNQFNTNEDKGKSNSILVILYALNTLGAALGAFSSSFIFIQQFGVTNASHVSTGLNILIFALVLIMGKSHQSQAKKLPIQVLAPTQHPRNLYAMALLIGAASLCAQIVWNKYLGIFFGTNIYGLGLILSLYLFGMATGSFVIAKLIRTTKNQTQLLGNLILLTMISIMATSYGLSQLPYIVYIVGQIPILNSSILTAKAISAGVVLLAPTILFGALLPLIMVIIKNQNGNASKVVGNAYAINTVGSIVGSYLTAMVLLPKIGSKMTISFSELCLLFSLLFMGKTFWNFRKIQRTQLALVGLAICLVCFLPTLSFSSIIKTAYLNIQSDIKNFSELHRIIHQGEKIVWQKEGETAVISLGHDPADGEHYKNIFRLKTNGLNESVYQQNETKAYPKFEALLATLPFAFAPKSDRNFIVGYGGGYTVDTMAKLTSGEIHVAELEKAVIEATKWIHRNGRGPLNHENVKLTIQDARYELLVNSLTDNPQKFDIIVSQPSHSWLSGVANLFTKEFFDIVKLNLTPDGVYGQWLNLYNMDVTTLKSILKTFFLTFPKGSLFVNSNEDQLILIGSQKPLKLRMKNLNALNGPHLQSVLPTAEDKVYDLMSNYLTDRESLWSKIKDAPLNTDDNAFAEIRQSNLYYTKSVSDDLHRFLLDQYSPNELNSYTNEVELANELLMTSLHEQGLTDKLEVWLKQRPADKLFAYLNYYLKNFKEAARVFTKNLIKNPNQLAFDKAIEGHYRSQSAHQVFDLIKTYPRFSGPLSYCYESLAVLQNKIPLNSATLSEFSENTETYRHKCANLVWRIFGEHYFYQADYEQSYLYLSYLYKENDYDQNILKMLIKSSVMQDKFSEAKEYLQEIKRKQAVFSLSKK